GKKDAAIFNAFYGVTEKGNFEDEKSILHVTMSIDDLAKQFGVGRDNVKATLAVAKKKLFKIRAGRIRPHRDEKVIAGWNGLMIASLAYGGQAFGDERYISAAERCAGFVLDKLRKNGRLMRYYVKGRAVEPGFLDDYAFMITGLLDLYEATFDAKWLVEAAGLSEQMIALFADTENGGFFLTGSDGEKLIVRSKPDYDGAVPSGNSVAALALLRLGQLTMQPKFTRQAETVLNAFSKGLTQSPVGFTEMLTALDFYLGPRREIVIAGNPDADDTDKMVRLIRQMFMPRTVLLMHQQGSAGTEIEQIAPFLKEQKAIDGKAAAYVCRNFVCNKPVTDTGELKKLLTGDETN
ncbi:MAG: thioredoxin domain-containing protein, partial [Planctomycetes bacterium]|nr:thioredoxin domain-containing protein [Planctomycetota bacterium]